MKRIYLIAIVILLMAACTEKAPTTYTNPILPGSHPDPSICRVGDDYYIVNSSFIWFPGVPIHKSKDLVNWELIGYALDTPEHLDVSDRAGVHAGIWAPTLRYHEGLFYLTVTQKNCGTSILSTAKNIEGPWSTPITLHSQNGIDGSILFDGDKNWYTWSEDHLILMREFNKEKLQLEGDTILLLNEQMFGDDYSHIEGPHVYKLENGEYMLLIASGGTGTNNHNVSVFKCDVPTGPYHPCPHNPVLTHRGTDSPFSTIGHADIVETQNGEWYAVMLGVRPIGDNLTIMDRETFMVKFIWENGWPVFNPDSLGMVMPIDVRPNLPWTPVKEVPVRDEFDKEELGKQYNFYHTPYKKWWSVTDKPGSLRIYNQKPSTMDQTNTPVVARRITQYNFDASTKINFKPQGNETAGLIAIMNQRGQMRLELFNNNGETFARVATKMQHPRQGVNQEITSDSVKIIGENVVLALKARGLDYQFYAGNDEENLKPIGEVFNGEIISRQRVGSYSGAYVGMFASSNGSESENHADFDYFKYEPLK